MQAGAGRSSSRQGPQGLRDLHVHSKWIIVWCSEIVTLSTWVNAGQDRKRNLAREDLSPFERSLMQVVIKSVALRRILAAAEVVAVLLVLAWIAKVYAAQVIARTTDAQHLRLAVKLDPHNAAYRLTLGRFYEYVPDSLDPQKAMQEFRRAVELSPYDPEAWVNLGAALEFEGKIDEAEACLHRTDYLAPEIPLYQWPIGNFYLLHGNATEAFRHFKVVLNGSRNYSQIIFRTAWKASGNPDEILDQLIPQNLYAEFDYLYYLLDQQQYADAGPVWNRIMANPEKFDPKKAAGYMDSLITAHRPEEAYQVWTDLEDKGLTRYAAPKASGSLITNGDFEDTMLDMGFGWRIVPVPNVYAGADTSTYHSPSHALLVQFSGKQNVYYRHVLQFVKVSPNRAYRLKAFMKTQGITTDSGPRLEVRDDYDVKALDVLSDSLTGDTNGWVPILLDFRTGPKTQLIVVSLTRVPSQKLDNLIAGRVWLDDVQLTPVAP